MMFKFCTQCGAKMPQENVFCTQCGAKFPVNTVNEVNNTTVQPVKSSKITDIALPKKEQVQNLSGNNLAVNKMAQDEFALGKEFMNAANPLHDYEKAIIHLKNAASSGIREAVVYIALSHLYLAADIIKNNPAVIAGDINLLNTVNSVGLGSRMTAGNIKNGNREHIPHNDQQNGSSGLQNIGKYAAAAAVGAVAGSMLHSATTSAAESTGEHVLGNITSDDLITPDLQDYADEAVQTADEYVPLPDDAADHIEAYNEATVENDTAQAEEFSAADSIGPAEDDNSFFDSEDSSEDGGLFDDLF